MNFFFSISYTPMVRWSFWGTKKVSLQIESVSIMSENGHTLNLQQESIRELRKSISIFVEAQRSNADKMGEKITFIGYDCDVDAHLLQQLYSVQVIDLAKEYMELANAMSDEYFALSSDYGIHKFKLPSQSYSLADKLEMIFSHPDIPQTIGQWGTMSRTLWIYSVNKFDVYEVYKMSRQFQQVVLDKQQIINNEQ